MSKPWEEHGTQQQQRKPYIHLNNQWDDHNLNPDKMLCKSRSNLKSEKIINLLINCSESKTYFKHNFFKRTLVIKFNVNKVQLDSLYIFAIKSANKIRHSQTIN